jgi:hypothetical protein
MRAGLTTGAEGDDDIRGLHGKEHEEWRTPSREDKRHAGQLGEKHETQWCACAAAMATAAQEREGEGHTKIPTQDDWKGDRHIHEPNTVDILTR